MLLCRSRSQFLTAVSVSMWHQRLAHARKFYHSRLADPLKVFSSEIFGGLFWLLLCLLCSEEVHSQAFRSLKSFFLYRCLWISMFPTSTVPFIFFVIIVDDHSCSDNISLVAMKLCTQACLYQFILTLMRLSLANILKSPDGLQWQLWRVQFHFLADFLFFDQSNKHNFYAHLALLCPQLSLLLS